MLYGAPPVYQPMLATSGAGKVRGEWAAEPKLDGWRALVTVHRSLPVGFEVRSRNGRFLTTSVPELGGMTSSVSRWCSTENSSRSATTTTSTSTRSVNGCSPARPYRERRRVLEMLDLSGPAWCTVPSFPFDDAEDLLDACIRLKQEGVVLKRMDARYMPGVRSDCWRKVKTPAWRTDHAPRRLPKEIRERIIAAHVNAMPPQRGNVTR